MTPKIYIKGPDGRIVAAPRGNTQDAIVDGAPVILLNEQSLKPGWSRATADDLAALAAANAAADKARDDAANQKPPDLAGLIKTAVAEALAAAQKGG